MAPSYEEKRAFPRLELRAPLRYCIRGAPQVCDTLTHNISRGGLGLLSREFIAPKTVMELEVNILKRILRPKGQVCWSIPMPHSNQYHNGICFKEIEPGEKNYLKDYLDLRLGKL